MKTGRARARRRAAAGVLAGLLTVTGTSACTGDDDAPSAGDPSPSQSLATEDPVVFEVVTNATLGTVTGRLSRAERKRVVERAGDVVKKYVQAAYGGSYPRKDFSDAFPGFTPGARDRAERDADLLTNRRLGDRIEGVTRTRSEVLLDVLGVRGHAAAVTARLRLGFRTEGDVRRRVTVRGRLLLTRGESGWQVFGYHVSKGVV